MQDIAKITFNGKAIEVLNIEDSGAFEKQTSHVSLLLILL